MDIIFIRGLVIKTVIGINVWERCCLQKLVFDLDVGYCSRILDNGSGIDSYLDYKKISDFVYILVRKNRFFLLESVAESVARELMLNFSISWIRVRVCKIGALAKDVFVGVVIERGEKID